MKDIEDWMCLQINTAAGLTSDRRQRQAIRHVADPSLKQGTWLQLFILIFILYSEPVI